MIPPTSLGLLVFTFILLIDQIPRLLAILVARSADLWTIVRVFLNLLPSILAVTVPMAFLLGVLLAFGRMASDSEIVALRAVGVSPLRLLGPVLLLSTAAFTLTLYINAVALPAANQAHRELVFNLVVTKARTVVKPRTFTDELLPGRMMLYVSDIDAQTGDWREPARLRQPAVRGAPAHPRPHGSARDRQGRASPCASSSGRAPSTRSSLRAPASTGSPASPPSASTCPSTSSSPSCRSRKGDREMTLPELQAEIGQRRAAGPAAEGMGPLRGGVAQEVRDPHRLLRLRAARPRALPGQQEGGARAPRSRSPSPSSSFITCSSGWGSRRATPASSPPSSPCGGPTSSWARRRWCSSS